MKRTLAATSLMMSFLITVPLAGPSVPVCSAQVVNPGFIARQVMIGPIQPVPIGACCNGQGGCTVKRRNDCRGTYLGNNTVCGTSDCNNNGTTDACDIAGGLSLDVNADGVPDECQVDCQPPCDAWHTIPGANGVGTHHSFMNSPIPADFFGLGSAEYNGAVDLVGVPIDPTQFSTADTLVKRTDDPIQPSDPVGWSGFTDVQIRALRMESVQPITVFINGQPTQWDVFVGLSAMPQELGQLWADKLHPNGGTFSSFLTVLPRFVFRRTTSPYTVLALDAGEPANYNPIYLGGFNTPWVHTLLPDVDVFDNLSVNFVAGVEELTGRSIPKQVTVQVEEEGKDEPDVDHSVMCPPDCCDPEPKGACCLPDGTCIETTPDDCAEDGGDYFGDDSLCEDHEPCCDVDITNCNQPLNICVGDAYTFMAQGFWQGTAAPIYCWTVSGPGASKVTPQSQMGPSTSFQITALQKSDAPNDVTVTVEIKIGGTVCASDTCDFTVAGVEIDQCPTTLDVGDMGTIHASAMWGGTASFTYQWSVIAGASNVTPQGQSGSSSTFVVTAIHSGNVTVKVQFFLSGKACGEDTCTFTIEAQCGVSLTGCPIDLCVGGMYTFHAAGTWEGTAAPIYEWSVSGPGAAKVAPQGQSGGTNTFQVTALERSDAQNDVTVSVTMYIGGDNCGTANCSFTVAGVEIDVCPTLVHVGEMATMHADAIWGGTASATYNWTVVQGASHVDPDSQSGSSPTFVVNAQSPGEVMVQVEFIKSGQACGTDTCTFVIEGDCEGGHILSSTPWLVVHDPPFERDHCQPSSVPRCKQAELVGNRAQVVVQVCDDTIPLRDIKVWLVEEDTFSSNDMIVEGAPVAAGSTITFHFRTTVGSATGGAKTDAQGQIYVEGALLPEGPTYGIITTYAFELWIQGDKKDSRTVIIKPLLEDLEYTPDILANPVETLDPYGDMFDIVTSFDWGIPDGYGQGEGYGLLINFDLNDDLDYPPDYLFKNDPAGSSWGGDQGIVGDYLLYLHPSQDSDAWKKGGGKEIKWECFTDNMVVRDPGGEEERAIKVFMEGLEAELMQSYNMGNGVVQSRRGVGPRYVVKEGNYLNRFNLKRAADVAQQQQIEVPLEVAYEVE